MILDVDSYIHNPLTFTSQFLAALGLSPGVNTEIRISKGHQRYDDKIAHSLELDVDWKLVPESSRRSIKRCFKGLEVPKWALGGTYKEPPMEGSLEFNSDSAILTISITVNGAYVCEKVGEEEQEPSEYSLDRAAKLEAMTEGEIRAKHLAEIAELRAAQVTARYRCRPS